MNRTTIAELINYLKTLPQDATVKVLEEHTRDWQTSTRHVDLDLPSNSYFNTTGNILELGQ